jgi:hypothetical protein
MLVLFVLSAGILWVLKPARFDTPTRLLILVLLLAQAALFFERGHHPELEAVWEHTVPHLFGLKWKLEAAQAFFLAWLFGLSAMVLCLEGCFKETYHKGSTSIFLLGLVFIVGLLSAKTAAAWLICYGGLALMNTLNFLLRVDSDAQAAEFRRFTFFQALTGSFFVAAVLLSSLYKDHVMISVLMLLGVTCQWGLYPCLDTRRRRHDWRQFWLEDVLPSIAVFSCLVQLDPEALPLGSLGWVEGIGVLTLLFGLMVPHWAGQFRLWFAGLQAWLWVFFLVLHPSLDSLMKAFLALALLGSFLVCLVGERKGQSRLKGLLFLPLLWFALGGQGSVAEWCMPLESASTLLPMCVGFLVILLTLKMCLEGMWYVEARVLSLFPVAWIGALSTSHLLWHGSLSVGAPRSGFGRGVFLPPEAQWLHPIWSIVCLLGLSLSALWSFGRKPFWRMLEAWFQKFELEGLLLKKCDVLKVALCATGERLDHFLGEQLVKGFHWIGKAPELFALWMNGLQTFVEGWLHRVGLQLSRAMWCGSHSFNHGSLRLYGALSVLLFVALFVWTGWWV